MRISDWSSDVCSSDLIADAVLMVLRRNPRQRIGLVAMTLEILLGDTTEDAGEAAFGIAFLLQVARLQQVGADLRPRRVGHLLDPDDEHEACLARGDAAQARMHRSTSRGAGVLHPRRPLEAQGGISLQHQGRGEVLRSEEHTSELQSLMRLSYAVF